MQPRSDRRAATRDRTRAIALVAIVGVRSAILLSIIPWLLAALAIVYVIRHTRSPEAHQRQAIKLIVRPLMHGQLGRLMVAIGAFEFGNLAATLMILRATDLLGPGRTHTSAVQLALVLYTAYNAAGTLASIPAGRAADRIGTTRAPRDRRRIVPPRLHRPRDNRGQHRTARRLLHRRRHRDRLRRNRTNTAVAHLAPIERSA